jgi:hypothetical protein
MTKRKLLASVVMAIGLIAMLAPVTAADDTAVVIKEEATDVVKATETPNDKVVVYYLHGTRRCATCIKLESYSEEAVTAAFGPQLETGEMEWKTVNYDEEENTHFIEDYQLFTKSVILSRVTEGKETEWKNLDQIWKLVGDKEEFVSYVQMEVANFLVPDEGSAEE